MARTIQTTRYPLLKVLVPLAVLLLAIGLFVFFTQDAPPDQGMDPQPLVYFVVAAAAVAFASLLWKRKEVTVVTLPSDRLGEQSREELQALLDTLEKQRDAGQLSPQRYTKARNKVLEQMKRARP